MGEPSAPKSPSPIFAATLQEPFPPTITFYAEANTTDPNAHKYWYNTEGKKLEQIKDTEWQAIAAATSHVTIAPPAAAAGKPANTVPVEFSLYPGSPDVIQYWSMKDGKEVDRKSVTATSTTKVTSSAPADTSITSEAQPTIKTTKTSDSVLPSSTSSGPVSGTTVPTPSGKGGLSSGAVAGVAIGCLLAGALIAGLLAWFCLRRRKPTGATREPESSTVALMHREKGPVAKTTSLSSGSPIATALEHGLPQPLEDKAISGEISKISNLIKNHVQSYYHSRAVSPGMIDYDDLQALGENLPVSVGTLSTLLNNSATREIALRFCLAWVVTSRIRLNDSSNTTFLPPEIAKSIQSMNHIEQQSRGMFKWPLRRHGTDTLVVHSLLYGKWRALTAELLQPSYNRNPFSASDGRTRNIQAAATLLDSVLRPFADSRMDNGTRSRNLEEILKRSAQFAFTLFSQPTAWDFDWQNEQGVQSGSLCIFPALVQTADENGEPLQPPRPFSEAVNRRLDE